MSIHLKSHSVFILIIMLFLSVSCVTINVYFPASAAQEAATEIVNDVLNGEKAIKNENSTDDKNQSFFYSKPTTGLAAQLIELLIPAAHAQSQPNLFIDTPKIRDLRAKIKKQHAQIKKYFQQGNIGFTDQGLIQSRTLSGLSIKDKSTLKKKLRLVNSRLNQLYAEIALANNHPEWKGQIQQTFAKTWISQMEAGWMYLQKGKWLKK